jgi:flagellar biogenesis protein FliO
MEPDVGSEAASLSRGVTGLTLKNVWQWGMRILTSRKVRRLRVCESLSLGERRFLAVVEFDHQEFLVGGSGNSLELLARLHEGMVIAEPGQRPSRGFLENR